MTFWLWTCYQMTRNTLTNRQEPCRSSIFPRSVHLNLHCLHLKFRNRISRKLWGNTINLQYCLLSRYFGTLANNFLQTLHLRIIFHSCAWTCRIADVPHWKLDLEEDHFCSRACQHGELGKLLWTTTSTIGANKLDLILLALFLWPATLLIETMPYCDVNSWQKLREIHSTSIAKELNVNGVSTTRDTRCVQSVTSPHQTE